MRKYLIILFSIIASLTVYSKSIEVTDTVGRHIKLNEFPQRIICIAPGCLRLITYLNSADKVVGVEQMEKMQPSGRPYWLAHPELKELPTIGPGGVNSINQMPDIESILKVKPDLIFITYMSKENADRLEDLTGIPVVVLSYGPFGSFDSTLYTSLETAGKILQKDDRAKKVINYIEKQKNTLSLLVDNSVKKTVYIGGLGFKGTTGVESTSSSFVPFRWVKANNVVVTELPAVHVNINKEKLLLLNPDYIFITGGNSSLMKSELLHKIGFYSELKAFKNKNVYNLYPFNWYVTNIGTAIIDAYAVGKFLYPKNFEEINLADKANEIYEFLIGKPVYSKMEKDYGILGERVSVNNK